MALTRVIDKEAHAKLPPAIQTEYKAEGEGFVLDLTDYEDPAALKRAKDHERDQAKEARKQAKELQTALDTLTEERDGLLKGSIPKADLATLEKSWATKLATKESELNKQLEAANGSLQRLLVDNVAGAIAAEISTSPALLIPHIKARLKADKGEDGSFVTKVVDAAGAPSALTVEELKKEFVVNPAFKAVITGSKASGGGAGGGGGGGGANAGKIDFTKSPKDIAAALKASGKVNLVDA